MLNTGLDSAQPWSLTTEIPVYALARVQGAAPQRQWLVYAFAPKGTKTGVQISVPGYATVNADATVAGAFYLVDEATSTVTSLGNGDPGIATCGYTLSPGNSSAPAPGTTAALNVSTETACSWTATSKVNWISLISGASGVGSGTLAYSIAANTGPARSGNIVVAGQTFTVTQDAATIDCTFSISPASTSAAASGGTGSVNVAAGTGCAWNVTSNASWISVQSGATGSGNGTVNYTVSSNTGAARTATLTVAGQTFTINQAAAAGGCTISLKPMSANLSGGATSGTITVTSALGCKWTAVSNNSWIAIDAGASGTGKGTVTYSLPANAGPARSGTITISGQAFTITQRKGK